MIDPRKLRNEARDEGIAFSIGTFAICLKIPMDHSMNLQMDIITMM